MRMPRGEDGSHNAFDCRTCGHSFSNAERLTIHISGVNCLSEDNSSILKSSDNTSSSLLGRQPNPEAAQDGVRSASTAALNPTSSSAIEADGKSASPVDKMPGLLTLSRRGPCHDHDVHRSRARVMPRRCPSGDSHIDACNIKPDLDSSRCQKDEKFTNRLAEIAKKHARLQELKRQREARMATNSDPESNELVSHLLVSKPRCGTGALQDRLALSSSKVKNLGCSQADTAESCSSPSSSPSLPSRQPHAELLAMMPQLLPVLLKSFDGYRTHQQRGQGSQGSPSSSTPSSQRSQKTAGTKRRLSQQQNRDDGEDDGSNSDEGFSRGKPRSRTSPPGVEQKWACPFCKWKPLSYQGCHAYVLKDISRVKQHLRRRHRIQVHCAICFEAFGSEEKRDAHLRARCCEAPPNGETKTFEGVTREQQEMLERRVDKSKSKSEQWYSIYEILFPGEERPQSPFVDSEVSTHLKEFNEYMADDGMQLIRRMAVERMPAHLRPQEDEILTFTQMLFQHAVPTLVQQFEASKGKGNAGADPDSSPTIPDTPAMSLRGSGGETSASESIFASPPLRFEGDFSAMDDPTGKPSTTMGEQYPPLRDPIVVPGFPGGEDDSGIPIYDWSQDRLSYPDLEDLTVFDDPFVNFR